MIVAFKNQRLAPDWTNRLIGIWTKSDWVHVEMLLTEPGRCAVSARTTNDGVTAAPWDAVLQDAHLWEYYEVPVSSDREVWNFLLGQTNKAFNYVGLVAGQVFGSTVSRPDAWFCSELTYAAIVQFGQVGLPYREPATVSPALLRQYLIDANCEKIDIHQLNT